MDRIDRLELFTRIVEGGSFARAADELTIARSSATEAVKALERETGVRLLARTTRHVTATPEGEEFYRHARAILSEYEHACGAFRDAGPRGHLRVDAPGLLTRTFLVPRLPEFLARYPDLTIAFGQSDRYVDLVREGVDCVLRAGTPDDSSLHMRHLGNLPEITCASPAYLAAHGMPRSIDDLQGHQMVGFVSSRSGRMLPLEFCRSDRLETRHLTARVTTDSADTAAALAAQGLGIIQAPRYRFAEQLSDGSLVEILADTPPEPLLLNAIHAGDRITSRRLDAFLDWVKGIFADQRRQADGIIRS